VTQHIEEVTLSVYKIKDYSTTPTTLDCCYLG